MRIAYTFIHNSLLCTRPTTNEYCPIVSTDETIRDLFKYQIDETVRDYCSIYHSQLMKLPRVMTFGEDKYGAKRGPYTLENFVILCTILWKYPDILEEDSNEPYANHSGLVHVLSHMSIRHGQRSIFSLLFEKIKARSKVFKHRAMLITQFDFCQRNICQHVGLNCMVLYHLDMWWIFYPELAMSAFGIPVHTRGMNIKCIPVNNKIHFDKAFIAAHFPVCYGYDPKKWMIEMFEGKTLAYVDQQVLFSWRYFQDLVEKESA